MRVRATSAAHAHERRLDGDADPGDLRLSDPFDIPDLRAIAPGDALDHQDLMTLLDQALGFLPTATRSLIELHYMRELAPNEVALRLGMTVGAVEVQLHRARRRLRQVLSGELRAEAEGFGIRLDDELPAGWRETREWCHQCGRRRLVGAFEVLPDGQVDFRLRCPDCSARN